MAEMKKRDEGRTHQHFKLKDTDARRFKLLLVRRGQSLQDWCESQVKQFLKEARNA